MSTKKIVCSDTGESIEFKAGRLGFKEGYSRYLRTQHWRQFRNQMMKEIDYECFQCGGIDVSLQLHHVTYKRVGNESKKDVLWLCGHCHAKLTKKINNIKKRRKDRNIEVNEVMNDLVNVVLMLNKHQLQQLLQVAEHLDNENTEATTRATDNWRG